MHKLSAFFIGLLFGLGLMLSGMTDPGKIQGFLDLTGAWDPSLALVMGGALAVSLVGFSFARRRARAILGGAMHLPTATSIDRRLVLGSLVFGVGWGLAGFCPGPGLVSMASGEVKGLVFVLAMLVGMLVFESAERLGARPRPT